MIELAGPLILLLGDNVEIDVLVCTDDWPSDDDWEEKKLTLLETKFLALLDIDPAEELRVCLLSGLRSRGSEPCASRVVAWRLAIKPIPSILKRVLCS